MAAKRLVEARATKNQIPRQVLGLGPNATEAEIRKAYKSLCLAHHPDKHAAGTAEAQTRAKFRFARIQAALTLSLTLTLTLTLPGAVGPVCQLARSDS